MAISLVPQNVSDFVKLVSINDSAIVWEESYPDAEKTEDDEDILAAKKRVHLEERDISKLVFATDDSPTFFVFKNPRTLENSKEISNIQLGVAGIGQKKKKYEASDLWFATFDELLVGTASDVLSDPTPVPRDRHTKRIEKGVLQALAAQGVVSVMAGVLLSISRDKTDVKKSS